MNPELATGIEISQAQSRNCLLGDGPYRLIRQSLLPRYQAQAERQYRRAIEDFDRLKARRKELWNEANSAESATTETTYASCETNPIPRPRSCASPRPPTSGPPGPQLPAPGPRPPAPRLGPSPSNFPPPAVFKGYYKEFRVLGRIVT
jgi:hypothetical protein